MLIVKNHKAFANGVVYAMHTYDDFPIETTDTFLPYYTKFATEPHTNILQNTDIGSRSDRWMIGVSTMSGCPVRCGFCASAKLRHWRKLTATEIAEQVSFVISKNMKYDPQRSKEFKINYTRMGEPFLNLDNVREAIDIITEKYPGAHHYISTIGISGSDFSWITENISLQISLHSFDNERRNKLIPFSKKMSISELGRIRTDSSLKTTLNLTLVDNTDFDINILKQYFNPSYFFIKLSPINKNTVSESNCLGNGIIKSKNLI